MLAAKTRAFAPFPPGKNARSVSLALWQQYLPSDGTFTQKHAVPARVAPGERRQSELIGRICRADDMLVILSTPRMSTIGWWEFCYNHHTR